MASMLTIHKDFGKCRQYAEIYNKDVNNKFGRFTTCPNYYFILQRFLAHL